MEIDKRKLTYSTREMSQATGVSIQAIQGRARNLVKAGVIAKPVNRRYPYPDVLKILVTPPRGGFVACRPEAVRLLKSALAEDGVKIKKD